MIRPGINQAKLLKGTSILVKNMDITLKRYIDNVIQFSKHMEKKNGDAYLVKKKNRLEEIFSKLK